MELTGKIHLPYKSDWWIIKTVPMRIIQFIKSEKWKNPKNSIGVFLRNVKNIKMDLSRCPHYIFQRAIWEPIYFTIKLSHHVVSKEKRLNSLVNDIRENGLHLEYHHNHLQDRGCGKNIRCRCGVHIDRHDEWLVEKIKQSELNFHYDQLTNCPYCEHKN